MAFTFFLAVIGWTFFRAPDIATAFAWLKKMLIPLDLRVTGVNLSWLIPALPLVAIFLLIEWFNRTRDIPALPNNRFWRWAVYYVILFIIWKWFAPSETFIYFQF